jgi:putative hydrolase of the HAD superfamily
VDTVEQAQARIDAGRVDVLVSDLDGVLRRFDPALWERLDRELELSAGTSFTAVLQHPYLERLTRGDGTFEQWCHRARVALEERGVGADAARDAVEVWAGTPAEVDPGVRALLLRARASGIPSFVFTNGTDRVPEELHVLGLEDVLGAEEKFLLNSFDLGGAKPETAAFAAAHGEIEIRLRRGFGHERVLFLDDSVGHVRGAQDFGWQAIVHS